MGSSKLTSNPISFTRAEVWATLGWQPNSADPRRMARVIEWHCDIPRHRPIYMGRPRLVASDFLDIRGGEDIIIVRMELVGRDRSGNIWNIVDV